MITNSNRLAARDLGRAMDACASVMTGPEYKAAQDMAMTAASFRPWAFDEHGVLTNRGMRFVATRLTRALADRDSA